MNDRLLVLGAFGAALVALVLIVLISGPDAAKQLELGGLVLTLGGALAGLARHSGKDDS
jgi:hypothetical protein